MITIIIIAVYIAIGLILVLSTLHISQYNLNVDPNKWRVIGLAVAIWPIFFMLMAGYWVWAGYHSVKNYISEL